MAHRIDIQPIISDTRAQVKTAYFQSLGLSHPLTSVGVVDSYVIDAGLNDKQLARVAEALTNPVTQRAIIDGKVVAGGTHGRTGNASGFISAGSKKFGWAIEIGFLPGVTDNVGTTARETIEDLLKKKFKAGEGIYSSQVFFISGKLAPRDIKKIAGSLYNPLIQRATVQTFDRCQKKIGSAPYVPKVNLHETARAIPVDLQVKDDELARIGKEGIMDPKGFRRGPLALNLAYMKQIRNHFAKLGRNPTDIELEALAQTWSEHCKHTIFADPIDEVKEGLYKRYIKGATEQIRKSKGKKDFCVSVFTDNSGAIVFDDKYLITHKVETHNTPSALDPFGGAITGIGGVNRDTLGFGLGAKPIANVYGFCVADPRDESELYRDSERKQKMLSARRIMEGVVAGINAGGNQAGIPTPTGFIYFDKRFRGKPLVFAGTVGLIPRKVGGRLSHVKRARAGDYVVMAGGRVGLDGIHGATFSSEGLSSDSPATAVQIGDPITQKKMSDALVREARDLNLYNSITDNGAGGLSCSVAEMARESGGCLVYLDKVPLKYPGMAPWQIWISESQERMTLAVPKNKWQQFQKLMQRRGVEAMVVGEFTDSGTCMVKYKEKNVMDLDMKFLHDGRPIHQQNTALLALSTHSLKSDLPDKLNLKTALKDMLGRPNLASFSFISQQYDHEVQGTSIIKPLQGKGRVNGDAAVIRPVLDSSRGVVLTQALYPSYSELSPYDMAACCVDSAVRQAVATGADPDHLALLDNFCWCSSQDPKRLAQLKAAARACFDYTVAYGTPFISGKDSMFNDFHGFDAQGKRVDISILPTLLISAIGVIKDVTTAVSIDLKSPGDLIYVLGETYDELGGSEFVEYLHEYSEHRVEQGSSKIKSEVPRVDAVKNNRLYHALAAAIKQDLVASAISVGRGGLAVALAKTAMAGNLGVAVDLAKIPGAILPDANALFSESQGRVLVGIDPNKQKEFEAAMLGTSFALLGKATNSGKMEIKGRAGIIISKINEALTAYHAILSKY